MPRWPHVIPRLSGRDLPAGLAGAAPLLPVAGTYWSAWARGGRKRVDGNATSRTSHTTLRRSGSVSRMRQLTALDALFLAAENDRTHGHVSALGMYDPVTASGRPLDAALVRELVSRAHALVAPVAVATGWCAVRPRPSVLG